MSETYEGGCFCKAVRYRMNRAPMFVNCCHCRNCQNQTGSAFVINAVIETDQIELLSGELTKHPVESGASRSHDIYRCSECGVAVWSEYGRPWLRALRVSTLDDPDAFAPGAHIFTRSKLSWVVLSDEIPAFEVEYDAKELWPAENLARAKAAYKAYKQSHG